MERKERGVGETPPPAKNKGREGDWVGNGWKDKETDRTLLFRIPVRKSTGCVGRNPWKSHLQRGQGPPCPHQGQLEEREVVLICLLKGECQGELTSGLLFY